MILIKFYKMYLAWPDHKVAWVLLNLGIYFVITFLMGLVGWAPAVGSEVWFANLPFNILITTSLVVAAIYVQLKRDKRSKK